MRRFDLLVGPDCVDLALEVEITGPLGSVWAHLVFDTGAEATTLTPELAAAIGYTAADALRPSTITSALGVERGYWLQVAELSALGVSTPFAVQVFPLGHLNIDGLLGMNFLRHFNFEVRPRDRVILAELAAPA